MAPPLLHVHHQEWFAYRCTDKAVRELTGASLQEAAEVCTSINGAGFTEEVNEMETAASAFDLAVGRIAKAVLEESGLALDGPRPRRGKNRSSLVVDDDRAIKLTRLQVTATLGADSLFRPIAALFGSVLKGENAWQTAADGDKWVRTTFSPTAAPYVAALQESLVGAETLKPTALFRINAFIAESRASMCTFPTTVVTEIACAGGDEGTAILVEAADATARLLGSGASPITFAVQPDWPAMVRVRSKSTTPLQVQVI